MRNWIIVLKKVRKIIHEQGTDSTLLQAKYVTDFIRKNFKPKKKSKVFLEERMR